MIEQRVRDAFKDFKKDLGESMDSHPYESVIIHWPIETTNLFYSDQLNQELEGYEGTVQLSQGEPPKRLGGVQRRRDGLFDIYENFEVIETIQEENI